MDKISICRAAYLIPFIDVLHDIGAPVERELARAKLPKMVEETPDEFISNILVDEFLADSERREGIDDLGWLWAERFSSSTFSTELLAALRPMPTVKSRLDRFASLSRLEDSDVGVGVIKSNGSAAVFCDIPPVEGMNGLHISEWTQVMVLIEIIRSITGKTWFPDEIRFKSDFKVGQAARKANPNTRFITHSAHTSIILPSSVLAASNLTNGSAQVPEPNVPPDPDPTDHLKRLIRPYLREGSPKIEVFAEVVGASPRSLQRKLKQSGLCYSKLIETARFEMAAEMLRESDIPLIDVAMMFGYENQSNFGRSFRRVAGMSPGKYRREMLGLDRAA